MLVFLNPMCMHDSLFLDRHDISLNLCILKRTWVQNVIMAFQFASIQLCIYEKNKKKTIKIAHQYVHYNC